MACVLQQSLIGNQCFIKGENQLTFPTNFKFLPIFVITYQYHNVCDFLISTGFYQLTGYLISLTYYELIRTPNGSFRTFSNKLYLGTCIQCIIQCHNAYE